MARLTNRRLSSDENHSVVFFLSFGFQVNDSVKTNMSRRRPLIFFFLNKSVTFAEKKKQQTAIGFFSFLFFEHFFRFFSGHSTVGEPDRQRHIDDRFFFSFTAVDGRAREVNGRRRSGHLGRFGSHLEDSGKKKPLLIFLFLPSFLSFFQKRPPAAG